MTTRADIAIGNAIADQMHRQRVKQSQICQELGISQPALSKKLRGERAWSIGDVIAAADALKIDAVDLLREMWGYVSPPNLRGSTNLSLLCGRLEDASLAS